ncbi:HLA class II histocompatibility antigen, DRB1-4 beta chain-like, partial [Python bivittatus]|uniref:HLA class II histocompatibility antigen, DRB1-4 beta chain-like n=1 Tax=Python bivittatus TaxID=176946 RepID=A0A9F2WJJ9_PYTBI
MGFPAVPLLLLLVGALPRIPGSEGGQEPPAHFLHQTKSDCHFFNGTQRVRFLARYFYDRQEFVRFNSDVGRFVAVTPLGQRSADNWNLCQDLLQYERAAVDRFCREAYRVGSYRADKTRHVVGRRRG